MPSILPDPGEGVDRRRCLNCGQHVDPAELRVLSGRDGRIHNCPSCSTKRESYAGGAAGLETRDVANQGGHDGI